MLTREGNLNVNQQTTNSLSDYISHLDRQKLVPEEHKHSHFPHWQSFLSETHPTHSDNRTLKANIFIAFVLGQDLCFIS